MASWADAAERQDSLWVKSSKNSTSSKENREVPSAAKALGRKVRGFVDEQWRAARMEIVVRGNSAKFSQHAGLRDHLLKTGDAILVEAAPRDRIWGIGLGAKNEKASNPAQWRGLNLLGFALMEVRSLLNG